MEDPAHVHALRDMKKRVGSASATERLQALVPSARDFLTEMHRQGNNIGGAVGSVTHCVKQYGALSVEKAVKLVLVSDRITVHHVRTQLERFSVEEGRHAHLVRLRWGIPRLHLPRWRARHALRLPSTVPLSV